MVFSEIFFGFVFPWSIISLKGKDSKMDEPKSLSELTKRIRIKHGFETEPLVSSQSLITHSMEFKNENLIQTARNVIDTHLTTKSKTRQSRNQKFYDKAKGIKHKRKTPYMKSKSDTRKEAQNTKSIEWIST